MRGLKAVFAQSFSRLKQSLSAFTSKNKGIICATGLCDTVLALNFHTAFPSFALSSQISDISSSKILITEVSFPYDVKAVLQCHLKEIRYQ